jgi:hypothetical protein
MNVKRSSYENLSSATNKYFQEPTSGLVSSLIFAPLAAALPLKLET